MAIEDQDMDEKEVSLWSKYEKTEKKPVGEGTYGEVFKGRCLKSQRIVAMKRINSTTRTKASRARPSARSPC
jgi:hypothetical protein